MAIFKKKNAEQVETAEQSAETVPVEQTETTEEKPKPRTFEYDVPSVSVSLEHFLKALNRDKITYTTAIAEEYSGKPLSVGLNKEDIFVICGDFTFVFDAEEVDGKRWLKSLRPAPKVVNA